MFRIERANLADAEALMTIKIRAFSEDVALYGAGPPGYDSLEQQRNTITSRDYYKFLFQDQLIGGGCVREMAEGEYYLASLYIEPNYHNRHLGTQAMQVLFEKYPQAKRWTLDTPYRSFRNHHFYEKLGFIKVGETEPDKDTGFHLFMYARES